MHAVSSFELSEVALISVFKVKHSLHKLKSIIVQRCDVNNVDHVMLILDYKLKMEKFGIGNNIVLDLPVPPIAYELLIFGSYAYLCPKNDIFNPSRPNQLLMNLTFQSKFFVNIDNLHN